ncbi:MAG: hypothetical protein ACREE2_09950 [Stellaceae bacterium]
MSRTIALLCLLLLAAAPALAQSPPPAEPPQPSGPPATGAPQPLGPPVTGAEPGEAQPGRVFCGQNVTYQLADSSMVPEDDRRFLGVWSDAAWDANTCAALIVQDVKADGTASIIYVFGPLGADAPGPGGVLHGTGVIRDGELRFQNTDGSQFAFRPGIVDMQGHLIKPDGESFAATFKQTP